MVTKKKRALKRAAAQAFNENNQIEDEKVNNNKEDGINEEKLNHQQTDEQMVSSEDNDDNDEMIESSDEDESSSESENDNDEKQENINIEFEVETPFEEDFHGIKQLLLRVLLMLRVDVSELTDLIIQQNNVGSTVKIADQEESEVYGIMTALSCKKCQEKACIKELQKELIAKAKTHNLDKKLEKLFAEKNVAYLINERFLNIPGQLAAPMHKTLISEVEEARKEDALFNFDYLLLISKTLQPTSLKTTKQGESSKDSTKKKDDIEYTNFEDEIFHKMSEFSFSYCVTEATGLASNSGWDMDDTPMNTYRTLMCVPMHKWSSIVKEICAMVEE